ncbi:MAG: prepilin-type N-terminal cleavage/methylation domain-containing protein [Chloroflexi bacterium]|nr:prepilin-type N-terminal cleavage/methylation domain-containing protein [Chloroflexota bacterium]
MRRGLPALADDRGFTLVEWVVAIGITATALVAALVGIAVASRSAALADERLTAGLLARSQLESIKAQPYATPPDSYPAVGAPPGYSVQVQTLTVPGADANIELVRVTVYRQGQALESIESYRVNR